MWIACGKLRAMDAAQVPSGPGMESVKLTPGERIRLWRTRQGLSSRQLAADVGVSAKSIGRYEADQIPPPSDVLGRIAVRLGISTDYILGLKEASRVKLPGNPPRPSVIPGGKDDVGRSEPIQHPLIALHG